MIATTWRKQAACRGLDVEAFYPVTEDDADAAEAKAVCAVCPVRQACLEHALARREREGVWGGRPSGNAGGSCASAASPPERDRRAIFFFLRLRGRRYWACGLVRGCRVKGFQGSDCVFV